MKILSSFIYKYSVFFVKTFGIYDLATKNVDDPCSEPKIAFSSQVNYYFEV